MVVAMHFLESLRPSFLAFLPSTLLEVLLRIESSPSTLGFKNHELPPSLLTISVANICFLPLWTHAAMGDGRNFLTTGKLWGQFDGTVKLWGVVGSP
jgi:hypothetical protein